MLTYPALIEREKGMYWVTFPDIDGVAATGKTLDDAIRNADDVLRIYIDDMEKEGWTFNPPTPSAAR